MKNTTIMRDHIDEGDQIDLRIFDAARTQVHRARFQWPHRPRRGCRRDFLSAPGALRTLDQIGELDGILFHFDHEAFDPPAQITVGDEGRNGKRTAPLRWR